MVRSMGRVNLSKNDKLTKAGLPVRDRDVHVVLLAALVDREALKVDVPSRAELGLDWAGNVDGRLDTKVGHAILEHLEVDSDDASHLDGAAEGYLAVTLCYSRPM